MGEFPRSSNPKDNLIYSLFLIHSSIIMLIISTKSLSYNVVYTDNCHPKGKIVEEVLEHDLAYGAKCPVTIDSKEEGIVLLSELSPSSHSGKFVYTVMIFMEGSRAQVRYEVGIDARRIKYRQKVAKEIICAHDDAVAADAFAGTLLTEEQSLTKSGDPPIIANTPMSASVVPAGEETVPSSITCGSVTGSGTSEGEVTEGNKKRNHRDIESPLTITPMWTNHRVDIARSIDNSLYKQESLRSVNSSSRDSCTNDSGRPNILEIVMRLPEWIQRDRQSQQSLFCKWVVHSVFPHIDIT